MRVVVLLLALTLAGCVATPGAQEPADAVAPETYDAIEAAIGAPVEIGHDHADPALHEGSYNLDLVALVKGEEGRAPQPTEAYMETAVKGAGRDCVASASSAPAGACGGFAYLSRTGPDQGLAIFDVSDVEKPTQVGYIKLEAGFEPDVEVSDDGQWAFWETQRFPTSAEVPSLTEPGANLHRGVHIVDISDKAAPRWAGYSPTTPDGPHSITYASIGGRHILLQSVYAFAYAYGNADVPGQQRLVISELDTSLPVASLRTLAEYVDPDAQGLERMPHDVSVYVHPVTNRTYAYIGYWDVGVVILDVTDPAAPERVGVIDDFGPAGYADIHMARQFPETIDGRVVVVAEPEIGAQPDSGYITFHDVTDPTAPVFLSAWLLPGNLTSEGGSIGPHYFDVAQGRVALASYHAGFWVIDVHDATNLMRPRTVAYALVNATGQALPGPASGLGAGSSAFDAWWWKQGEQWYLVGGDVHGGLAVYRYTGPAPDAI